MLFIGPIGDGTQRAKCKTNFFLSSINKKAR